MSDTRYPQDLVVSLEDFKNSGWKPALDATQREGYSAMWQTLSTSARSSIDQGCPEQGKVLWLLADACSMVLSPESPNEPFKPFAVFHDRRSVIPDDLSD